MRSYRIARRSFLAGIGGALGLRLLLDNLEGMAQGLSSPPRFMLFHFPTGTLRYSFVPEGEGADYTPSRLSQPFEDAQLRDDMTIFYGFSDGHIRGPGAGGHEGGTVFTTTCCNSEGTRDNGGEVDDAVAGGPSFDQVFLENVPGMKRQEGNVDYANVICDERVDSNETSNRCLSYGYTRRTITSAMPGGEITENVPLLAELSPAESYANLFSNYVPGGNTETNRQAALNALRLRQSVLDSSLSELNQLESIAPSSEAPKIEAHAEAIRNAERQLADQLEASERLGNCDIPSAPDPALIGQTGNSPYQRITETDDSPLHRQIALAHAAVLRAAFQCDLIRAATFQFAPSVSHVSFGGMWPSDPTRIAMHHPVADTGIMLGGGATRPPPEGGYDLDIYEFLVNVQLWYNTLLAEILSDLKATPDVFGNSLLDHMLVPFVTEVAEPSCSRSPKPAYLFGGSALGMKHGTFVNLSPVRPQVDLYLTAAQALFGSSDVMSALSEERFVEFNPDAAPIDGLWEAPA